MTYNGWSNYETWAAKLWMDNDEGAYHDVTSKATELAEEARDAEEEPDAADLATWLREYADETMCADAPTTGLAADLFRSAFGEIDFHEIAESLLSEVKEDSDT